MGAEFNNLPVLDGWVNLTEASKMLGISRQHAFKKTRLANAGQPGGWKTVHRVGTSQCMSSARTRSRSFSPHGGRTNRRRLPKLTHARSR